MRLYEAKYSNKEDHLGVPSKSYLVDLIKSISGAEWVEDNIIHLDGTTIHVRNDFIRIYGEEKKAENLKSKIEAVDKEVKLTEI